MNTPETVTLSSDARFKLREILRSIPGSHDQWPDVQDVLDNDTVDVSELLRVLATVAAAVRTIVADTDRDLAQLRRERDIVRSYLGTTAELADLVPTQGAYTVHVQPTKAFTVDEAALTRWASRTGPAALEHDLPDHGSLDALEDSPSSILGFELLADLAITNHVIVGDPRLTLDIGAINDDAGEAIYIRITTREGDDPRRLSEWTRVDLTGHDVQDPAKACAYLHALCAAANKVLAEAGRTNLEPILAGKEHTR
ncbi:Uncharacterised protein [Mycobacteroides abscessus subsp. abscessus]|uniref:hypothetical protein n=1 Tax=Mycobacteroides abscessus TaxID=36809 RepID=UPI0009A5FA8C|nr:hypothetical protein [Mycobacteroides abscessus]SLI19574.1 Uncharacterised protein [Mycobacteroides abscessus subsp. abscessus]